jgi:predicted ATPase
MRLLALSGQREAALAQYETFRRLLAEEMDVAPTEETVRLHEQIQAGELTLPTPVSQIAPKHNLPAQTTPFVGRETELAELAQLLADPDVRLLTILGAGGMGKTRLALQAAADILSDAQLGNFQRGVFFVSLAPLQSVDAIVPTVAQAIGFSFYRGGEPRQQLLDYLRQKNMLLIMDNFEHLLAPPSVPPLVGDAGGESLVIDILKTAPDVKILATSRARLNVRGEHRFQIAGMECPDWETSEDAADSTDRANSANWAEYSAVKLFLQGARRARPGFELEADDFKYVSRICRLVQGMPLGILLAAAWVEMLTPEEVADQISGEISQSLDFLGTDLRDVPERQRSMRAVFDHSFNLLSEREREVFQALSVFRGSFAQEAAQRVAGASLRELMALVNRSLLHRTPTGRYQVHELTRQYAANKLGEMPAEEEGVKDRHCAYYAGFLQGREAHLLGRNQKKAAAEIEVELENVRSGWRWAVAQGKIAEIARSLEALGEFYWMRGWYSQGEETLTRAAQTLEEEQKNRLGTVRSASLRDADAVTGGAQEEIANRRFRVVLGKVLLQQGVFCEMLGLKEKAKEPLQKSLAIFRDLDAQREMAWALRWLGHNASSLEEQKRLYLEGLAIFEKIGDRRGILLSLWGLGHTANAQGEYETGKQLHQKGFALARELGNQIDITESLYDLGVAALNLGRYEDAKQLLQESLPLRREFSDFFGTYRSLLRLANACWGLGEFEEAEQLLQESLAICKEIGNLYGVGVIHTELGQAANLLGKHAEAIQLAQEGLKIRERLDHRWGVAQSFRVLGNAACGLGDLTGAGRYFQQTLEIIMADGLIAEALHTLVGVAALLAAEGHREGALELLGLILHHRASAQWTRDRAATLVTDLQVELPSEVVAAALERGQARDLEATVAELLVELEA